MPRETDKICTISENRLKSYINKKFWPLLEDRALYCHARLPVLSPVTAPSPRYKLYDYLAELPPDMFLVISDALMPLSSSLWALSVNEEMGGQLKKYCSAVVLWKPHPKSGIDAEFIYAGLLT